MNTSELNVNSEPGWFCHDKQGMLPHSTVGSPEDFRSHAEARGNTELLPKIPTSNVQFGVLKSHNPNVEGNRRELPPRGETNALDHWNTHMRLRRSQQDSLSGLLQRPVENLLMNHASRFRETQEKREMLNQVLPLVHSGYGHCVGGEFWRLPQRYGDEMSGIAATLTKTERGIREPCTQIGIPSSIRQESGLKDTVCHASRAWHQSVYLKQQCQKLAEAVQEVDFKKPDLDRLEVIGSSKPVSTMTCRAASIEDINEMPEHVDEDTVQQSVDIEPDAKALQVPALRVCGNLAKWTGNTNTNLVQGGINTTILFEGPSGEQQLSHLELVNEGKTTIFYSWQQIPLPHHFPHLLPRTKKFNFSFNSSSGVILPGNTQIVDVLFKSDTPSIQTELWQLNTHPVLLQGSPVLVTLRGVAADQRRYTEKRFEKKVTLKMCRTIVCDIVKGIHTPHRPSSPAELYQTEEEEFLYKNPKIFYKNQPIEDLKSLWYKVQPENEWDLSISTLRQALRSLPVTEVEDGLNQDTGLAQLNSVLLQLYEASPQMQRAKAATIGQLLWRELLDTMTSEAVRLSHLLQLPEKETWLDQEENKKEDIVLNTELTPSINEEKMDKKAGPLLREKRSLTKSKKDMRHNEDRKKGKVSGTDLGKDRRGKEADVEDQASEDPASDMNLADVYTRLLQQKVYELMENLVESLCDICDEWKPIDNATKL
ncbi:unnamed protein product [Knipowitschia caucasica]